MIQSFDVIRSVWQHGSMPVRTSCSFIAALTAQPRNLTPFLLVFPGLTIPPPVGPKCGK